MGKQNEKSKGQEGRGKERKEGLKKGKEEVKLSKQVLLTVA